MGNLTIERYRNEAVLQAQIEAAARQERARAIAQLLEIVKQAGRFTYPLRTANS